MNSKTYNEILNSLKEKDSFILAIDGVSASGKTTLSLKLAKDLNALVIHTDDFFLPASLRTKERLEEIGGNIDYVRFKEEVIDNLDKDITYKKFDCKTMSFKETIKEEKSKRIIIEGAYSMHPHFGSYYTDSIFLEISYDCQIERLSLRDIKKLDDFKTKWIPKEHAYFSKFKIKDKANLIIFNEK